jgi:hypothetical protein
MRFLVACILARKATASKEAAVGGLGAAFLTIGPERPKEKFTPCGPFDIDQTESSYENAALD